MLVHGRTARQIVITVTAAKHAWQAPGRHDRHTVHDYLPPGDLGAMDGHDRYTGTPRVEQDLGGYFMRPP
jgi:hypothetical protein